MSYFLDLLGARLEIDIRVEARMIIFDSLFRSARSMTPADRLGDYNLFAFWWTSWVEGHAGE